MTTLPRSILLGLVSVALSAPAVAAPCASGSLASYIALGAGGCEIDSASFRSFASLDVSFGALKIDAGDILVTPLVDDALRPGLSFQLDASAGADELLEILIAYEVLAPSLQGVELAIDGSSVTGDGANTAVEDICLGGSFDPDGPTGCTGLDDVLIVFDIGIDSELAAAIAFADLGLISVVKDIAIDGGLTGAATLGVATNRFLVPEPTTAWLLAAGLVVFARRNRFPLKLE